LFFFFFSSRRRHTRCSRDWSSDVCSSDLARAAGARAPCPRVKTLPAARGRNRELLGIYAAATQPTGGKPESGRAQEARRRRLLYRAGRFQVPICDFSGRVQNRGSGAVAARRVAQKGRSNGPGRSKGNVRAESLFYCSGSPRCAGLETERVAPELRGQRTEGLSAGGKAQRELTENFLQQSGRRALVPEGDRTHASAPAPHFGGPDHRLGLPVTALGEHLRAGGNYQRERRVLVEP